MLVVGLGGAVATTAAAGIEMLRAGSNDMAGLPLAGVGATGIAAYRNLHFAGWDLHGESLDSAVREHRVLDRDQSDLVSPALAGMTPREAAQDPIGRVELDHLLRSFEGRGAAGANTFDVGRLRALLDMA